MLHTQSARRCVLRNFNLYNNPSHAHIAPAYYFSFSLFASISPPTPSPHADISPPFSAERQKKKINFLHNLYILCPPTGSPHLSSSRCREIPDVSRGLGSQLTEVFPGPGALFVFSSHVAEPCLSGRQKVAQLSPFALNLYSGGLAGTEGG